LFPHSQEKYTPRVKCLRLKSRQSRRE
jgi:hypothetical protein